MSHYLINVNWLVRYILNGCVKMSSKRKKVNENQISIFDMALRTGDRLFKDGKLYGEISGESESLYFVMKAKSLDTIPTPYHKDTLRERILTGKLTLEEYNYN